MRLKLILRAVTLAVAVTAVPAVAQTAIDVPAVAGWKHAQTGIVLRPTLGGLARTDVQDNSQTGLDITVNYGSADRTLATIYIFRPSLSNVPVWFDRSETQILLRDVYDNPTPQGAPVAFALPNGTVTSGLRRVYVPGTAPYKATGLAILPLGDWIVAIRFSSTELDARALDAKMSELIATIGWPALPNGEHAAAPVAACTTSLPYNKAAKLQKPDMASALLGGMLTGALAPEEDKKQPTETMVPPVTFCREGTATREYAVYHRTEQTDGYLMAVGDAGVTINVTPGIALGKKNSAYQVTLGLLDKTVVYPDFDKLPSPDKAFQAVLTTAPVSSVVRGSKDINISITK